VKNNFFKNYFIEVTNILNKLNIEDIEKLDKAITAVKKKKSKILVFGNGANISLASHFATDMTKNGKITTSSFNDGNLITCFSNDYGFENWIQNTIKYYSSKNDLIILLSASGTSKNIIKAAKYCYKNKFRCVSIYGFNKKNNLSKYCGLNIWIDAKSYNLIEIAQAVILLSIVDKKIGSLNYKSNL
jgi:D-sedoheptulose 7-phosphate isomerase